MLPASIRSTSSGVPTHSVVAARSSDTFWLPPLGLPTISIPSRGRPKPRARYGGYRYRDRASNFLENSVSSEVGLRRTLLPRLLVNRGPQTRSRTPSMISSSRQASCQPRRLQEHVVLGACLLALKPLHVAFQPPVAAFAGKAAKARHGV